MINYTEIFNKLKNYQSLSYGEEKYSFLIVKPNGTRHFRTYVDELKKQNYTIVGFFAIHDFATINVALHNTKKKLRHIIPINNMFNTFFSNYAILILIAKSHITYEDFVKEVCKFKVNVRSRFDTPNLAYVFDISALINDQQNQLIKIVDSNGQEVPKREMNQRGTFKVYSVNSLHSPDPDVDVTISEMEILRNKAIFKDENLIPNNLLDAIFRYETFAFIRDM